MVYITFAKYFGRDAILKKISLENCASGYGIKIGLFCFALVLNLAISGNAGNANIVLIKQRLAILEKVKHKLMG